jgi:diacylglycerol kinase family enzyme
MDSYGKIDLTSSENANSLFTVFRNTSTSGQVSFIPKYTYSTGYIRIQGMDAGNLDGDGKPDLAIVENYSAVFLVYINQNGSDLAICPNGSANLFANLTSGPFQWQVNTGSGFTNISNNSNY